MFNAYLEIIKPRIIIGNIILMIGSFLFASSRSCFCFFLFLYTILGTSLIIASACVFNNLIDCDIDKKMKRTSKRVLPNKIIHPISVLIFAVFLGFLGILILGLLVNLLSMFISIFGFFIYIFLYTLIYKRKSIYSTFIGSFSGSTPAMIGYTSVTNTVDICSILLFLIFIFWQMAHFYAIAIVRIEDYQKAKIPVFPVVKGVFRTKIHIFYYILGFNFLVALLTFLNYTSFIFFLFSFLFNFYWLSLSYFNLKKNNHKKNARQLFYYSILVVIILNFLMSIDYLF